VKKDYTQALKWTRAAASKGVAEAEQTLGFMLDRGMGVVRDHDGAVKWYCSAADKGLPEAQNTVAYYVATAKEGRRDLRKAAELYTKAAEKGVPAAQLNLGILFATGRGVPLDYAEAFYWFSLAKANGSRDAAKALEKIRGVMTPVQRGKAEAARAADRATRASGPENHLDPSPLETCPLF
jgi:TPR repeat protein